MVSRLRLVIDDKSCPRTQRCWHLSSKGYASVLRSIEETVACATSERFALFLKGNFGKFGAPTSPVNLAVTSVVHVAGRTARDGLTQSVTLTKHVSSYFGGGTRSIICNSTPATSNESPDRSCLPSGGTGAPFTLGGVAPSSG